MSDILEKLSKDVPLEIILRQHFIMEDVHNWVNGEYYGNADEGVDELLDLIEEWYNETEHHKIRTGDSDGR